MFTIEAETPADYAAPFADPPDATPCLSEPAPYPEFDPTGWWDEETETEDAEPPHPADLPVCPWCGNEACVCVRAPLPAWHSRAGAMGRGCPFSFAF